MNNIILEMIAPNARTLEIIRNSQGVDKNTLRECLDVSLPTVLKILSPLEQENIIRVEDNKYQVTASAYSMVGIAIGSSQTKILIVNAAFEIMANKNAKLFRQLLLSRLKEKIKSSDEVFEKNQSSDESYICYSTPSSFVDNKVLLDCVFECIKEAIINDSLYSLNIVSIGVSVTGLVNRYRQEIVEAHTAPFMEHESIQTLLFDDFKEFFEEKGIKIYLEQNSRAAMIAEKSYLYTHGSVDKNCENMACIYLATGISCGIIVNNRLLYGRSGYSGEIGHLTVPYSLEISRQHDSKNDIINDCLCPCGKKNCFNHLIRCNVFGMDTKHFSAMTSESIRDFLNAPENEDRKLLLGKYLGTIAEILCDLLNLELIIFTGKLGKSGDILTKDLLIERDKNVVRHIANDCKFSFSELGVLAPAVGAAISSFYKTIRMEPDWNLWKNF